MADSRTRRPSARAEIAMSLRLAQRAIECEPDPDAERAAGRAPTQPTVDLANVAATITTRRPVAVTCTGGTVRLSWPGELPGTYGIEVTVHGPLDWGHPRVQQALGLTDPARPAPSAHRYRRLAIHTALAIIAATATVLGVALFINLAMTSQWLPAVLAVLGTAGAAYWTGIEGRAIRKTAVPTKENP